MNDDWLGSAMRRNDGSRAADNARQTFTSHACRSAL